MHNEGLNKINRDFGTAIRRNTKLCLTKCLMVINYLKASIYAFISVWHIFE